MQKYAFVDRDGTILIEPEKPHGVDPREAFPLKNPNDVEFVPGALEGLAKLKTAGYRFVLVTNQPFLGTPKHPRDTFDNVMNHMRTRLAEHGIEFDFEMICPHGPDEGCGCRKPGIAGVKEFVVSHDADLPSSFMFGDRDADDGFAKNLGVRFVKIKTNERFELPSDV